MSSALVELDRVGNLPEQRRHRMDATLTRKRRHQQYPNGEPKATDESTQQMQRKRKKRKVKKHKRPRRRPIMAAFNR